MELAPGTPVTDSVRLVEPLGEGGMASVWIAEHTSLRTKVAVKFISKELLDEDSSMAERFAREASMSAQIKSPYVVQTFDHGVMPDGQPYIVMELLEGESLDHHLVRETILSLEMTNQVVSQTAKALSKAHKLGIVHRDIKPDNLFMTWEDEDLFVKVLDFGVAKRTNLPKADSVTGTGMMVGTPEFMSPEQVLSAKSVDLRADLWALAVVAYRCLTGRVPFQGETLGSLCVAIAGGQFTSPTELRPDLPSAVDRWFVRGLAVEADDRFGSARELAQSLSMALVGKVSGELSVSSLRGSPADWSGAHAPATTTGDVTVAPGQGSRTFAGTTMAPHQKNRRRTALLSLAAVALVIGGFFALGLSRDDATPSAAPDPPTGSVPVAPKVPAAPAAGASIEDATSDHTASATPSASADPQATATSDGGAAPEASASARSASSSSPAAQPPGAVTPSTVPPKPVPTSAPPQPTVVDRGF